MLSRKGETVTATSLVSISQLTPIGSCVGTLYAKDPVPIVDLLGRDVDGKVVCRLLYTRIWKGRDEKTHRETRRVLFLERTFFRR